MLLRVGLYVFVYAVFFFFFFFSFFSCLYSRFILVFVVSFVLFILVFITSSSVASCCRSIHSRRNRNKKAEKKYAAELHTSFIFRLFVFDEPFSVFSVLFDSVLFSSFYSNTIYMLCIICCALFFTLL